MLILVTGASGFLGRAIVKELLNDGHGVVAAVRDPQHSAKQFSVNALRYIHADFRVDLRPQDWKPRLAGVETVINAAGILQQTPTQRFAEIHTLGPQALFTACVEAGVRRIVQISALGADEDSASAFHLSKRLADTFLMQLPILSAVVQPSLVYGQDGMSSRLFRMLATLPLIPLPGNGLQRIQPIHVHDAALAVAALVHSSVTGRFPLVGSQALSLREYLCELRKAMHLGRAHFVAIPPALLSLASTSGGARWGMPDKETLAMLERGNTADPEPTAKLLGRNQRAIAEFIPRYGAAAISLASRLDWLSALLRLSIALVWFATGILSLGVYPVAESYALLERTGVPASWAPLLLYGAAMLDLVLGVATMMVRRRWIWMAQAAVIVGYTLIITWKLPEFWMHPYGPVLKNLPLLAGIWLMYELDRR